MALEDAGLPRPVLQCEVHGRSGLWLARTDFGWPELRTVGEYDGKVKYGRLPKPGQAPGDVVFEEKRREDTCAGSLRVARWTWDELTNFDPVAERLRRASGAPERTSQHVW